MLKVSKTNNSVLKALEHEVKQDNEDVVETGQHNLESRGVCCRSACGDVNDGLKAELGDGEAAEACDWRIAPHAYGDKGKLP